MSLLASVQMGRQIGAQIHTIYGNNGVGKTTWAAAFPGALIIDLERGSNHLDVARIPASAVPDLAALKAALTELKETKHDFKTVVIDSIESLEGLINDSVCAEGKVDSIEKYGGGYGKGYQRGREVMREIMTDLQGLQQKGLTSILVGHTQKIGHVDPAQNQNYDRITMRCNDKMAAIIRDLSDNVFYATFKVFTTNDGNKTRAFGDGQRVMFTQWRPGYDAKNRLDLPLELPLSYDAFFEACAAKPEADSNQILSDIREMAEGVDENLRMKVIEQVEKNKANPTKLKEIKNRLMKYVSGSEK